MVRKIAVFVCMLGLITALCGTVQAATHTIYENGTLNSTYTTYFKDILSGVPFDSDYVAFRSGQNAYTLVVGDIVFDNNTFDSSSGLKEYTFTTSGTSYNNQYVYNVKDLSNFSLNVSNQILYSNLGDYPQLMERGAKYEMLQTLLICIALLCIVISRIFRRR